MHTLYQKNADFTTANLINPHTFLRGIEPRRKDLKSPFIPVARLQGILEGVGIKTKQAAEAHTTEAFSYTSDSTNYPASLFSQKVMLGLPPIFEKEVLDEHRRERTFKKTSPH